MLQNLRRGALLIFLAVGAGALQECTSGTADSISGEQGCYADEQLFSSKDELQGLDLLQVEVRLQNEAGNSASRQTTSLIETTASVHRDTLRSISRLLARLKVQGAAAAAIAVLGVFTALAIAGFLAYPLLFKDGKQMMPGTQPPPGTPAAQRLVQAPTATTNPAQSPIMAQYGHPGSPTGIMEVRPTTLPPICPSLILPHTEARFMVPVENLQRGSGELDIRGTSGRKLLGGVITETPEGRRCLTLASTGSEEDPRVTLLAPASNAFAAGVRATLTGNTENMGKMELYGKGGRFYGTLTPAPSGGAVLNHAGENVMSLEIGGGSDLRMTASSMDGKLLASAGKNVTQGSSMRRLESADTWKLQVKPNYDAVLICSCMLGVMLFRS